MPPPSIRRVLALSSTFPARAGDGTPDFTQTFTAALPVDEVGVLAPMAPGAARQEWMGRLRVDRFRYALLGREALATEAILPTLRDRPGLIRQIPGLLIGFTAKALALTRRTSPDLLHAHWILPGGLVAAIVSSLTGVPFVVSAHGADVHGLNGRVAGALKRAVLRRATMVFPVSTEIRDRLQSLGAGLIGPVVPMGVDVEDLRRNLGAHRPEPGRLLFVGRLVDKKGVDVLLRSVASVPEPWRLHIVGDGPERRSLEDAAAALGMADRVVFTGRLDREQVLDQYGRAACVVLPSVPGAGGDRDGTPVVLMEAMALGVPVVVSAVGGLDETIDDSVNGLVVSPGDEVGLAAAISETLSDPAAAAERAARARVDAERRFDATVVATRLIEATEQALPE